MTTTSVRTDEPRPTKDLPVLVPLAWLALVLAYFVRLALSAPPSSIPTGYFTAYFIGQSGIVAAVVLAMTAWRRGKRGIAVAGAIAGVLVLLLQFGALPLDLYACSEWVRIARERGVFTLW